jgi:hypothetical protein
MTDGPPGGIPGIDGSALIPALTAGNGERLWEWADALEIVRLLPEHGLAILGCEVYRRHRVGWGTFVEYWDVEPPRASSESWPDFATRAAAYALAKLSGGRSSASGPDHAPGAGLLYFLAISAEADFGVLITRSASRWRKLP